MIKDFLISFKDNIRQKTSNPFLGTLIIVWIFHNYQNLYKLFFSGANLNFNEKVDILNLLFSPKSFLINLLEAVFISILVLITTYFLLNLSRLIVNFYEKIISPWVYKITDKSSIVLKSDFEKLSYEKDKVQKRLEEEKEKRLKLEVDIEQLEEKIKKNINNKSSEKDTNYNENDRLVELIENKGHLQLFEDMIFNINNNNWVQEEDGHRFLTTLGVISSKQQDGKNRKYIFTDRGKKFEDYYQRKYLFIPKDDK